MKNLFHFLFLIVLFSACGKDVTIIHVGDTHSHLEGATLFCQHDSENLSIELGGYDLIGQVVREEKGKRGKTIFMHSGDLIVGTRYFREFKGRSDIEMMNRILLDVMVLGNHEFDKGIEFLTSLLKEAEFPVLCANIEINDVPELENIVKPYIITGSWPWKNGIIGVGTPDTARISSPGEKIKFLDPAKSVKKYIEILKEKGVNRIFVLSHLGFEEDKKLAGEVSGIDVIIGGHSHTLLGYTGLECLGVKGDYPETVKAPDGKKVLIAHAWDHSRALGKLHIEFDMWGNITSWDGETAFLLRKGTEVPFRQHRSPTNIFKEVAPDEDLAKMVENYRKIVSIEYEKLVGKIGEPLVHNWEKGSDIAPLVSEAIFWKLTKEEINIDVALQNAGGVRRSLGEGDVTLGDINDTLPFFNDIVVLKIKGDAFLKMVNNSMELISKGAHYGSFPYLYGMKYEIEDFKAVKFTVFREGEFVSLDPDQYYTLATDSYIAYGGNGYEVLGEITERTVTDFIVSDVFAEFIKHREVLYKSETVHPSLGGK
jgi:5'-nucleotidase / UDP-sugar diphosphatase